MWIATGVTTRKNTLKCHLAIGIRHLHAAQIVLVLHAARVWNSCRRDRSSSTMPSRMASARDSRCMKRRAPVASKSMTTARAFPRLCTHGSSSPSFAPSTSRNRATGGIGLGLSTVRAVVLDHGGDVQLVNRPRGRLAGDRHSAGAALARNRDPARVPRRGAHRPKLHCAGCLECVRGGLLRAATAGARGRRHGGQGLSDSLRDLSDEGDNGGLRLRPRGASPSSPVF